VLVDHVVPHRGDQVLFWESSNWQTLCRSCHELKSAREAGIVACAHGFIVIVAGQHICPLCGSAGVGKATNAPSL
jgi:hypothetical protein